MNKFKLAALVTATLVSSASFAASETFNATVDALQDATISETTPLNFGAIQPAAGSQCQMDNAGAVTLDCESGDAGIALGVINVTDLFADSPLTVSVVGGSGTNVSFVADADILGGTATVSAIGDNTNANVTVNSSGDDLTINVFGTVTVDNALTAGATETAPYTVNVNFQ